MNQRLICGIDIGSTKVATVVALQEVDSPEPRIIGFNATPSRGVRKGLIVDIEQVTQSIERSVEKTERMAGHKINNAYVSVGGPHITSSNSDGVVAVSNPSEITQSDIDRAIETARAISLSTQKQLIEVVAQNFGVDGQGGIKNPVGMSGTRLEVDVHIITASATHLKNVDRCLYELGIESNAHIFAGLASSQTTLTSTEKELGVALVDIGGGKTDICVYVDGSLQQSVSIPIGARNITNDIAIGLRVSLESAEKIKLYLSKYAKNVQEMIKKKSTDQPLKQNDMGIDEDIGDITLKEVLDGIIIPRLEEIYEHIGKEIEPFYKAKQIPSGIVVTGGGAHTIGIEPIGRKMMPLPLRIGIPMNVSGLVDEVIDPQFASTVGLIAYAQHDNENPSKDTFKDINRMVKDVSVSRITEQVKGFFRQFMP